MIRIVWNAEGTHATVLPAKTSETPPAPTHTLSPGESYYGIPYEDWARSLGDTVDVLQRQWYWQSRREQETRPRGISVEIRGDDWQTEPDFFPPALPPSPYGFSNGITLIPCTREQLVRQCVEVPETPAVWTPDGAGLVRPEAVGFLVNSIRHRREESTRTHAAIAGAITVTAAYLAFSSLRTTAATSLLLLVGIAAAWLLSVTYEYVQVRQAKGGLFREARQQDRYSVWLTSKGTGATEFLLVLLAAVMLLALPSTAAAVEAAGLVKELVREGEVWRLLTGVFVHGGLLHLFLNLLALWSLGPLVEAHAGRTGLPVIFLISAIAGSSLSFMLLPTQTTVGASGGILGLAGYLFTLAYRRHEIMPAGFYRRIGMGIFATAVFGMIGYRFVDNATHLGGLLAGTVLAAWLPSTDLKPPSGRQRFQSVLAYVAWAVLFLGSLGAGILIYGGP